MYLILGVTAKLDTAQLQGKLTINPLTKGLFTTGHINHVFMTYSKSLIVKGKVLPGSKGGRGERVGE
jgi:hypothetical protein